MARSHGDRSRAAKKQEAGRDGCGRETGASLSQPRQGRVGMVQSNLFDLRAMVHWAHAGLGPRVLSCSICHSCNCLSRVLHFSYYGRVVGMLDLGCLMLG
ncbi:hypothetical protein D8674_021865 [Pyrus ussuriensis x Pyrus communis]|uniref:Uncharacterized protein n=1 Tax=Pyrus ussuriensis x Pyrus communis TaxID=2448454 RepID=A0A5N5GJG8_9ROSA|nr:hypothetical protein D8674_021865 [Pyrus ussuriensis x Pyrus communis]